MHLHMVFFNDQHGDDEGSGCTPDLCYFLICRGFTGQLLGKGNGRHGSLASRDLMSVWAFVLAALTPVIARYYSSLLKQLHCKHRVEVIDTKVPFGSEGCRWSGGSTTRVSFVQFAMIRVSVDGACFDCSTEKEVVSSLVSNLCRIKGKAAWLHEVMFLAVPPTNNMGFCSFLLDIGAPYNITLLLN